ncbi:unnamed protein product, partial [Meganyctiphanes norvegica]
MSGPGGVGGGRSYNFKIVLLGEGCVGKTSLVLRYVEDKFNDRHITTLQASFLTKRVNLSGKRVNLAIWDTAGQERFHALGPIYYRESHGAILVYDITDEDSFQKIELWVPEKQRRFRRKLSQFLIGQKTELECLHQDEMFILKLTGFLFVLANSFIHCPPGSLNQVHRTAAVTELGGGGAALAALARDGSHSSRQTRV